MVAYLRNKSRHLYEVDFDIYKHDTAIDIASDCLPDLFAFDSSARELQPVPLNACLRVLRKHLTSP